MPTLISSFSFDSNVTGINFIELTKPPSLAVNNLIFIHVNTSNNAVPTPPPGFFPVPGARVLNATCSIRLYQKVATLTEPDTYRVIAPDGVIFSAGICALAAVSLTYPVVHQIATNTSDVTTTNKVWNQVTNVDTDTILLCFGAFVTSASSTPHAGMTERWDGSSATTRLYLMSQSVAAAGATGTRTATVGSATKYRTVTLSISESDIEPSLKPMWATWLDGGALSLSGLAWKGSATVLSTITGPGTVLNTMHLIIAPPPNTKRMVLKGNWASHVFKSGGITNGTNDLNFENNTSTTLTEDLTFSSPGPFGVGGGGGTNTGTFTAEWELIIGTVWLVNSENIITSPPADPNDDSTGFELVSIVQGTTGNTLTYSVDIEAYVSEMEFSDGTIIFPGGVDVTEMPVIVELAPDAALYATQFGVLVEIAASGLYLTSFPLLIEIEYRTPSEVVVPTRYPRAAGTRAIHYSMPDEVTGYPLDPEFSWWATLVPEKGRNMLFNPSFEVPPAVSDVYDSAGFSAWFFQEFSAVGATSGKTCSRSTIDTSGPDNTLDYVGDLPLTPGAYTWSLDLYFNQPPVTMRLQVTDGVSPVAQRSFIIETTGWRRLSISWVEAGSGNRVLRVFLPGGENISGSFMYTDSWQLEKKAYATTYFDGDMIGFNDLQPNQSFFWEGAPHQSASVRRANTGAGGRPVSWSEDMGFFTTGIVGLGMGPVNIRTQEMSDGSEIHVSSTPVSRDFTVSGRMYASNFSLLQEKAREFTRLLRPNNTRNGDQGVLRFQQTDSRGAFVGAPLDIVCVYKDGLGGNVNNFYTQAFPIQFHASQPFPIETIDSAAALETSKLLYNNGIIFRDEDGDYVNLGIGTSDAFIRRVDFDAQGRPVAASPFNAIAGDVAEDAAYWDGEQWVQMGVVPVGTTYSIDGGWKFGYPTVVGANDGVYEYDVDLDSWSEIGDGLDGPVDVVLRDTDGFVYAGGHFDNNGSASNNALQHIAFLDPAMGLYQSLGNGLIHTSLTAYVGTLLIHDGFLYAGGLFDEIDSGGGPNIPANNIARWNLTEQSWGNVGPGFNGKVNKIILSQDGFIYAIGEFDQDGGNEYDLRGIARWNGNAWEEPFVLQDIDGDYGADGAALDENGVMWFYKDITTDDDRFDVSDTIGPSETFGWKSGIFYPSFLRDSGGLWYLSIGPGNRMIMSVLNADDPAVAEIAVPYLNNIDYAGDANTPMVVHMEGTITPSFVLNLDNGGGVYFLPSLTIGENEELVVRTDTQRSLMYSEARSSLYRYMSAGPSSSLLLYLHPGINRVSIFSVFEDDSSAWLTWRNRYWGIEAASSL